MAYIYILSNESMPGLLKIGMTTNMPHERASQLATTGVPGSFVVEEFWECSADNLRSIESDIHKVLVSYRIQNNREFFRVSIDVAKREIEGYFKRKGDLHEERENRRKADLDRKEKARKVLEAKTKIESDLVSGVKNFMDHFNKDKDEIEGRLENILPEKKVISRLFPLKRRDVSGRLVSSFGWYVKAGFAYSSGSKKPRELQEDNPKIYIFIGVKTKSLFGSECDYGGFFSVTYYLHSGKIGAGSSDAKVVNEVFNKTVFPEDLSGFLNALGLYALAQEWGERFGSESRSKQINDEGDLCPCCGNGILRVRYRRRDGRPFGGCSSWPSCGFTFDLNKDEV